MVNLVRTLVPQSTVQVPATRETHELAQLLPIPPTMPPPGSEGPLPRAARSTCRSEQQWTVAVVSGQ